MPISLHIPNLVKFYHFVIKILSENEKVKSIKGHNSVTNLRKMTNNNLNLHLVNINSHTKGVRAFRGKFGPHWSQKLKVAFHQFHPIGLLEE